MKYYGLGLFRHTYPNSYMIPKFEERVVLVSANSKKEAEKKILADFRNYSVDGIENLGILEVDQIYSDEGDEVLEVYSSMRVFAGEIDEFLNQHWSDLRPESCNDVGWNHVWHNLDNESSGCYNCRETRKGNLWKLDFQQIEKRAQAGHSHSQFWLEKPSTQGHPLANYYLGRIFLEGLGVKKDQKKAQELLAKASSEKCSRATRLLRSKKIIIEKGH